MLSSYQEMIRGITHKHNKSINKYCQKLFDYLNLNYFWYYKITTNGCYSFLGSHLSWNEYFGHKKYYLIHPYLRHPKYIEENILLMRDITYNNFDQILASSSSKFNLHLSLQLNNKILNGVESFGFAAANSDVLQVGILLNELPLLRLFCKKFKEDNPLLFNLLDDYKMDLAKEQGPIFYEKSISLTQTQKRKENFLKQLGVQITPPLTANEQTIIELLLDGYPASKIASNLFLSKRTIEHYIERIKDKLSCYSKAELIQKAREMEKLGYLKE